MKLKIMDHCIRCGMCEDYFPELFHFDLEEDCIKVLHDEMALVCAQVLADAGVYKQTEKGLKGMLKFLDSVGYKEA